MDKKTRKPNQDKNVKSILEMTNLEARSYFLESKNYTNIDLPHYFTFDTILNKLSKKIGESEIKSYCETYTNEKGKITPLDPKDFDNVNYRLLGNKDGEYAWRPFELIHPALYVSLVHKVTSYGNWEIIRERFKVYGQSNVICESIPLVSNNDESHKSHQIKNWWKNIEQRSLELAMKYQYTYDADISDCYGSIYTHSIAWAIHTKDVAKEKRKDKSLVGNSIDLHIQMMRNGQTNGIPQGSCLMDFIAEIVLGYVDKLVNDDISQKKIIKNSYQILRYRDDYKVLTNDPEDGRKIIKCLSETLSSLGMKLNTGKTKQNSDPIMASIKQDKIDELFIPQNSISMQKRLLQIYAAALSNLNSGQVTRMLSRYYDDLNKMKSLGEFDNVRAMLSIIVNLSLKNPKSYQWNMAITSKLLDFCKPEDRSEIINEIRIKFDRVPNTGLLDIWLQRVSYTIDPTIIYMEMNLTKLIRETNYPGNLFWNSSWLKSNLKDIVVSTPVIDKKLLLELPTTIERAEVELFKNNQES